MRINWEVVKSTLWTGAGGVIVGMILLSYGFRLREPDYGRKIGKDKFGNSGYRGVGARLRRQVPCTAGCCRTNSDPRRKQGLLLQNARGIPGSPGHLAGQKLSGFGPDRRMCKLDSRAAEGCEPQTVVAENVSGRSGTPCLGLRVA